VRQPSGSAAFGVDPEDPPGWKGSGRGGGKFKWSDPSKPGRHIRYHPGGKRFDAEHFFGRPYWHFTDGTNVQRYVAK
jgi:hypothetical protein